MAHSLKNLGEVKSDELRSHLKAIFSGKKKLLILGIGENRMGDDGIGPWIAYHLYRRCHFERVKIMNAGILPDQRRDEMKRFHPDLIIIIDAIATGNPPGTIGFYPEHQMVNMLPISTHTLPLPVFLNRLRMDLPTVEIILLGISPLHMEFEDAFHMYEEEHLQLEDFEKDPNIPFYRFYLSPQIQETGKELVEILNEVITEIYSR